MIDFRRMETQDLDFVWKLLNEKNNLKVLHIKPLNHDKIIEAYNNYWKDDPDELNYIIIINDISIGWLKINGLLGKNKKIWISELIISENYQHQGNGTNAIKFVEKYAKENGYKKICIMTQDDNINAKLFYEKCGYKIIDQKKGIANNEDEVINIVFQKII